MGRVMIGVCGSSGGVLGPDNVSGSEVSSIDVVGTVFRWEKKHDDAFKMIKLAKSVKFLQRINYESSELTWLVFDASNCRVGGYVVQGRDWKTAGSIGFYS